MKLWYEKNRLKACSWSKRYRDSHKDWEKSYNKKYYARNRNKIRIQTLEYRLTNKEAIAARRRAYRQKNRDVINASRRSLKTRTRKNTLHAIKVGKIKRLPCQRCGAGNSQAHHKDYSKPLDIVWLCAPCHAAHHARLRVPLHRIKRRAYRPRKYEKIPCLRSDRKQTLDPWTDSLPFRQRLEPERGPA